MNKSSQTNKAKNKKNTSQKQKISLQVGELSGQSPLNGDLSKIMIFKSNQNSQINLLGNQNFSTVQRQKIASQIGKVQGNCHLCHLIEGVKQQTKPIFNSTVNDTSEFDSRIINNPKENFNNKIDQTTKNHQSHITAIQRKITHSTGSIKALPEKHNNHFIKTKDANKRTPPPDLSIIPDELFHQSMVVEIKKNETKKEGGKNKEFVYVVEVNPETRLPMWHYGHSYLGGWTWKGNLQPYLQPAKYKLNDMIKYPALRRRTPWKYAIAVLKKAGIIGKKESPDKWFGNFVHTTFLGRVTQTPIHSDLAKLLRNVEQKLIAQHGGPSKDPWIAGTNLGLSPSTETIKGSRQKPTSAKKTMHYFGIAVDLDYSSNPFITRAKKPTINRVLERAGFLIGGVRSQFTSTKSVPQPVQDILNLDSLLEEYFSLLNDEKKLNALFQIARRNQKWNRYRSLNQAKNRISSDLTLVANTLGRNKNIMRTGGLTNLSSELIKALTQAGLHWGGEYGDMMHFDMQNTGDGKKIAEAR